MGRPWYRSYLPGWFVWGGGGAGAGTVQTDGVTIQGDGSAGNKIAIKAVQTQPRLTGAGTVASKLDIAGWPITFFTSTSFGGAANIGANQVFISGFDLAYPLTFAHITVNISTADAVNLYDFGVYSLAGILLANIGAQSLPATGQTTFATLQGSQTIGPGLFAFAWTGNANTAHILGDNGNTWLWVSNSNVAASVGGALPASIPAQTVHPDQRAGLNYVLT